MNSQQIRCFLEAAHSKSFSKAAKRMYVSQPSLSRYISQLEHELGLTLFERNSFNGVSLTESGEIMYEAFVSTHDELDNALEKARSLERTESLQMTIGLLEGQLIDNVLDELLTRLRLDHPNVTVSVRRDTYQQLMKALEDAEIDFACMPTWQFVDKDNLELIPYAEIETLLVVPKRLAPKAEDRLYSLAEFGDLPIISVVEQGDQPIGRMLDALFDTARVHPPIVLAKNLRDQIQRVEMGEGAILINPFNYICYSPNITCFHVKELVPQPFSFAWRKAEAPKAVSLFRPLLLDCGNRQ